MLHRLLLSSAVIFAMSVAGLAERDVPSVEPFSLLAPVSATAIRAALSRPDLALAKSAITQHLVKGDIGEALTKGIYANEQAMFGSWAAVTPRIGRQGLDHVMLKMDAAGNPRRLMVVESKFGSGKLIATQDGMQMSARHVGNRLRGLASRYRAILNQAEQGIATKARPAGTKLSGQMRIPLAPNESVIFWRQNASDKTWYFDGPDELLPKATKQLGMLAKYYDGAASGQISYARRIFVWKMTQASNAVLTIYNADSFAEGMSLKSLPHQQVQVPLGTTAWAKWAINASLADELRNKFPHLPRGDVDLLADELQEFATKAQGVQKMGFRNFVATETARTGALGAAFGFGVEALDQWRDGHFDAGKLAAISLVSGVSAGAGSTTNNLAISGMLRSQFGATFTARTAQSLGLRSTVQGSRLLGASIGGSVASMIFAYGQALMGMIDWETANRQALGGVVGSGAGVLVSAATLSMMAAYGTAGTGVAISTLGGAAATNASLAVLGGGTVASGGFGMAGGAVVLGTGVGVVVVAVGAGVMYGFHLADEAREAKRIKLMLNYYASRY